MVNYLEKVKICCFAMDTNHSLRLFAIEVTKVKLLAKYIYEKKSKINKRTAGYFHSLVSEMRLNDVDSFINIHRMVSGIFDEFLKMLGFYKRVHKTAAIV